MIPRCGKSSLMMVITVVGWLPIVAPPVRFNKDKLKVSSASNWPSLAMGIVTILLVSPAAKMTAMEVLL